MWVLHLTAARHHAFVTCARNFSLHPLTPARTRNNNLKQHTAQHAQQILRRRRGMARFAFARCWHAGCHRHAARLHITCYTAQRMCHGSTTTHTPLPHTHTLHTHTHTPPAHTHTTHIPTPPHTFPTPHTTHHTVVQTLCWWVISLVVLLSQVLGGGVVRWES